MIYVFDLDGTLCDTPEYDGQCRYPDAQPIPERIAKVNALYDEGHTIWIDSARGCTSGKNWLAFTLVQLREWGVMHHKLRTGIKLGGELFVDDLSMRPEEFFGG